MERRSASRHAKMALWISLALFLAVLCQPATAQFVITSANGQDVYKLGILAQFAGDFQDNTNDTRADNLFFRRLRLQGEFTWDKNLVLFFETDDPNLGKSTAGSKTGTTATPSQIFMQTVYMTYQFMPEFNIDAGLLLVPESYNKLQSATSILPVDLSPFVNNESAAIQANNGRDYGVELRGYIANHLEYRAGLFDGLRGVNGDNDFRFAGRLALYLVGIETSRFYRGTSLGQFQTFEVGGSYDKEQTFKTYDFDTFYDQPISGGNGFTFQVDYQHWDGGILIPTLLKQHTINAEAGFYIKAANLQPFFQYDSENFDNNASPNKKQWQGGLAYYFNANRHNLKLGIGQIKQDGVKDRTDVILQYQIWTL